MSWASVSLHHRHAVWAVAIAVVVFGVLAWGRLPIALFPETAPPLVNVVTAYPGASAADVAEGVSEPIEEGVAALDGISKVSSVSQDGLSIVTAEFEYGRNVDLVAVDVQNSVTRLRSELPAAVAEPRVLKFSTSDRPVVTLAVSGRGGDVDLSRIRRVADDEIQPILQRTPGVASVDVFGGARSQVNVLVERDRLEASGLSLSEVIDAVRRGNVASPAGRVERDRREILLRFDEQATTAAGLARLPVTAGDGQRVLLGDIAQVQEGAADRRSSYRIRGREAVALQVLQRQDANTVDVVRRVEALVPDLAAAFPDLEIEVATEEASFTELVVANMGSSIVAALVLASLVIFLFIGSFRGGLIVSISMPMSFLLALSLMQLTGMELNLVTLSAVILAVGIVVDASVVVLENIARHRKAADCDDAAVRGTDEVAFPILVGLLTTVIVLVPFLFLSGFVGQVFRPLATTMIFAFSSSLLAAVTLIPLLAATILRRESRWEVRVAARTTRWFGHSMERVREGFMQLLAFGLQNRGILLGSTVLLLLASVALIPARGMEVLPRLDAGSFFISIETEPGTSFSETLRIVQEIEGQLDTEPAVTSYSAQVGFEPDASFLGDAGALGVQQAFLSVSLLSRKERGETIWDILDRLRWEIDGIPGIRTAVLKEVGGTAKTTTSAPITVRLSGRDLEVLDALAEEASARVRGVPGAANVYRRWSLDQPEVRLAVDELKVAHHGLSVEQLAAETFAAVQGRSVSFLNAENGAAQPIVVRYAADERVNVADILGVRVRPGLPLGEFVTPVPSLKANLITREDLVPTAEVLAFHHGRAFSHVMSDVEAAVESMELPPGYEIGFTGEREDLDESGGQMIRSLLTALLAVYLLLVAQFRSFVHPLTVMVAVPLVLVGVSAALLVAGKSVSMAVLMALILLVGIAVNNSILLLDFVLSARRRGVPRIQAVTDAVSIRFRPIMMTSFSTIIGMLPLAMEWALGAERFSPMAVAIIGGLTASSLLTLVVIPVFYTVMDDAGAAVRNFTRRMVHHAS
jgi:multidrug efflux pump subunit AcrB